MLKRILCTAFFMAVFGLCAFAQEKPHISAKAAALMAADTGEVLFAQNETERLGIASTTKIMTALLTLEQATPNRVVKTTPEMVYVEGTSMGLKVGDSVSFHALVYGMLLSSGNDAANTAALSVSGSFKAFADLMNRKAKEIGMKNTHFVTPSGLDDKAHYSTAYDMALLGCYAIRNPLFAEVCSTQKATLFYGKEPSRHCLTNHNRLLRTLPGAFGIKTGYTQKSGRCLVSAVQRNGVTLVCVTLCDPNDWQDHENLYEYGFSLIQRKKITISVPQTVQVFGASVPCVSVSTAEDLYVSVRDGSTAWTQRILSAPYCFAPIQKGDVLGRVEVRFGDRLVASTVLVAQETVQAVTKEKETNHMFGRIVRFFRKQFRKGRDPRLGQMDTLCRTIK